jgi:hypothetical protein
MAGSESEHKKSGADRELLAGMADCVRLEIMPRVVLQCCGAARSPDGQIHLGVFAPSEFEILNAGAGLRGEAFWVRLFGILASFPYCDLRRLFY